MGLTGVNASAFMQELDAVKPGFQKFGMPYQTFFDNVDGFFRFPLVGQHPGKREKDLGVGLQLQNFFVPLDFFCHCLPAPDVGVCFSLKR